MKIFEIINQNVFWSKMAGIKTEFDISSEFEYGYDEVVEMLELLIRSTSPSRVAAILPSITVFESELLRFINAEFSAEVDTDLEDRKIRAQEMLDVISSLKQKLPQ